MEKKDRIYIPATKVSRVNTYPFKKNKYTRIKSNKDEKTVGFNNRKPTKGRLYIQQMIGNKLIRHFNYDLFYKR